MTEKGGMRCVREKTAIPRMTASVPAWKKLPVILSVLAAICVDSLLYYFVI